MAKDPAILAHQEWLGYVQPVGLVVSIPAMLDANVRVNQNFAPEHRNFLGALPIHKDGEPTPEVSDFPVFAESVLGWSSGMAAWIARLISIEGLTSVPWRESFSRAKTSRPAGESGATGGSIRLASVMKM